MPVNETSYAYAVGRIRSLETRLLDKNKLERMIEAASVEDAVKVLAETDYAGAVAELDGIYDFESMLQKELGQTLALLESISPRPAAFAMMRLPYDAHNLKVLLKARYLERDTDLLLPLGTLPPDKLRAAVGEGDYRDLPPALRAAAEGVEEEFAVHRDPQLIDLYLDRGLFAELLDAARKTGSPFLVGLFQRRIDLINLKTFIRVKRMGRDREFLKRVFLPGGSLELDRFGGLLEEPLDALAAGLAMTEYAGVAAEGVRGWLEQGAATRLEKLSDDYITGYLQRGKYTPFGLEPLIGYLWAKEIEVKNIRLILVGKINQLPAGAIRERLRDVYV